MYALFVSILPNKLKLYHLFYRFWKLFLILKYGQKNWFAVDFWNEWKKCLLGTTSTFHVQIPM